VLPPDTQVPAWLNSGLKYVAASVLPALIAPDVLFRDLAPGEILNVYRVIAASLAGLVAYKTRSTTGTLAAGMAVLWLFKWWSPF
jgi:branched-subunit amino acid transport protein